MEKPIQRKETSCRQCMLALGNGDEEHFLLRCYKDSRQKRKMVVSSLEVCEHIKQKLASLHG